MFALWLVFLLMGIVVCGPVWFLGKRRIQWTWRDYIVLVLPLTLWIILIVINGAGKSLTNAVIEPFWLGCSVPIAPLTRLIIGKRVNQKLLAISLLVILCLVATGLWMFVPCLPE